MTHDPLCIKTDDPYSMKSCQCDLIAKVREDMLATCIAAVERLLRKPGASGGHYVAALRALQERTVFGTDAPGVDTPQQEPIQHINFGKP